MDPLLLHATIRKEKKMNTDADNRSENKQHPMEPSSSASLQEPLIPQNGVDTEGEASSVVVDEVVNSDETSLRLYDGLPLSMSVLIKSLYFLDALGSSTWGRFSAIYYNLHGISSTRIGLIECLRTSVPTISMIVWGIVADRYHCRKTVWLFTKTSSTVILLMLALPWVYGSFSRILVASVSSQLFVSNGLLDAYTLQLLGTEHKLEYGKYRLYASLSWGLGSIVMGAFVDYWSFEWLFLMFGVLATLMIMLVGAFIPNTSSSESQSTSQQQLLEEPSTGNDIDDVQLQVEPVPIERPEAHDDDGRVSDLLKLALRPRVAVFLLEVVIMGAAMATVERLLFLYLVNDLGSSTFLCGLSVGVNVLFELPIFWFASSIMTRLSHDVVFTIAMIFFVVRVYGYTLLTKETKWWILPLESFHGVTFACFWITTLDISKILVHQTNGGFWSTAIPSSIQMLYSALGVSIGVALGGWAMERYGSRYMYRVTAGIVLITLIMQVTGSIWCRTYSNTAKSFLPSEDADTSYDILNRNDCLDDTVDHNVAYSGSAHGSDQYDDDGESLHLTREHAFGIIENGALLTSN
jgi:MFS family permease